MSEARFYQKNSLWVLTALLGLSTFSPSLLELAFSFSFPSVDSSLPSRRFPFPLARSPLLMLSVGGPSAFVVSHDPTSLASSMPPCSEGE